MTIDVFTHILPPKYYETLKKKTGTDPFIMMPEVIDLEARLKVISEIPDMMQVVTVVGPPLETLAKPEDTIELAKIANDELAEIVNRYPDKIVAAIASLPFTDKESTLDEIDRAIGDLGLSGIQMYTDVRGRPLDSPEFMPIYEKMEGYDLPIFIHPVVMPLVPDYPGEEGSRYGLFSMIGWPHATSMAMMRLSAGGVLEKYPNLQFVTHHAGGTVPYLFGRIKHFPHKFENLTRPITESLRLFNNDTAVRGDIANLMCAYAFFGAEHILFGTDFPMGGLNKMVEEAICSVNGMGIPDPEKKKIFEDNARRLLKLAV